MFLSDLCFSLLFNELFKQPYVKRTLFHEMLLNKSRKGVALDTFIIKTGGVLLNIITFIFKYLFLDVNNRRF